MKKINKGHKVKRPIHHITKIAEISKNLTLGGRDLFSSIMYNLVISEKL